MTVFGLHSLNLNILLEEFENGIRVKYNMINEK